MSKLRVSTPSLLWRVLLVTSVATVVLFPLTAYLIASYAIRNTEQGVQEEVHASLREFEFIWRTRAESLARTSRLFSTMSDVRGAFQTGDAATIRDTASELWKPVSQQNAVFLVFDPTGREIASLSGSEQGFAADSMRRILGEAEKRFPNQAAGFQTESGRLYYMILTPIYVASGTGSALLNVLVTGFEVDNHFAQSLSLATEGSDFVFTVAGRVVASTLPSFGQAETLESAGSSLTLKQVRGAEYASLTDPLPDVYGNAIGHLSVMRSLAASNRRLSDLKQRIAVILAIAIMAALLISYGLARHILKPIGDLDRAAAEISRRNYDFRLAIDRKDELGRLAETFNAMCDSIQQARQELIARERMDTIGRLSSSIVHDLRNPLAAIYGGSEMLVDDEQLPPQQARRLALSIYRASRHIQEMLRDLADSVRGKAEPIETCRLLEIAEAARELLATPAENQGTAIDIDIPGDFEIPLERSRMERVFLNLLSNALEATREGGAVRVSARADGDYYVVQVDDSGIGISDEVRANLFQPFFSRGKKNGLGLGLALSRQTLLDHGGELWLEAREGPGARFCMRLPIATVVARMPLAV